MLNDAFHARYLIYYYALFFTFLLFLQPLFLNGARSQVAFFLDSVAGAINSPSQIDSNVQLLDSSFWQEDQTTKLEKSATSLEEIQDLSLDNDISNDIPIDDTAKPDQNLDATIRVPLRQLETLSDRFGELNAERSGLRMQLKRMRDLVQLLTHVTQKPKKVSETAIPSEIAAKP